MRDNLPTGEGGGGGSGGGDRSTNLTTAKKTGPLQIIQYYLVTEEDGNVNVVIKHVNNKIAWVWT